jgi:hypothetical protein
MILKKYYFLRKNNLHLQYGLIYIFGKENKTAREQSPYK